MGRGSIVRFTQFFFPRKTPPPDPSQLLSGVLILHTCTLYIRSPVFYGWPDKNTARTDIRKYVYIVFACATDYIWLLNRTAGSVYTAKNQIFAVVKFEIENGFIHSSVFRTVRRRRQRDGLSQSFITPSTARCGGRWCAHHLICS